MWTEQPRLCTTLPCGQPALRHGRLAARGRHGALARASSWQLPQTAGKAATSSLRGTPGIYLGWGSGPAGRLGGACRMPLGADVSLVYCVHSDTKSMGAWGVRPRAVLGCKLTSQAPSQGQPYFENTAVLRFSSGDRSSVGSWPGSGCSQWTGPEISISSAASPQRSVLAIGLSAVSCSNRCVGCC